MFCPLRTGSIFRPDNDHLDIQLRGEARMKRFSMLSLSAVLALGVASISDSSFAQQRVTKDQLVGTWTFVSCTNANGGPPDFCVNSIGRQIFEATGQYMHVIAARGRPKSGDAIVQGFVSQFGNWSFNEADQTLTVTPEAALRPENEGREVKMKVSLTGDELRIGPQAVSGRGRTDIWRRVR